MTSAALPGGFETAGQGDDTKTKVERWFNNLHIWLNPIMGAVIGGVVLGLFAYAIYQTVGQINTDPVAATDTAEGYSAFDRSVQVIGLISPVLTIVLGFYFGARAGSADQVAASQRVAVAERDVESTHHAHEQASRAIALLEVSLQSNPQAQEVFSAARQKYPEAFGAPSESLRPPPPATPTI